LHWCSTLLVLLFGGSPNQTLIKIGEIWIVFEISGYKEEMLRFGRDKEGISEDKGGLQGKI